MNAALDLALVVGILAALLAAMAGLRHLEKARGWHPELQRKIIHVGAGGLACTLPWIMPHAWQVWLLLGLTAAAMLALRTKALAGLGGTLHGVERQSWGDFLLVLSVALVFLMHGGVSVLYVLPLAILTLADAAAALAGVRYGRVFFTTEDGRKSVEGSVVFFLVALILSMIGLLLLTDVARGSVITISVGVAAFATLLEADSWEGFDNLFLPMGVFIMLAATITGDADQTGLRIGLGVVAAIAVFWFSRATGSGRQLARVHGLAVFLLLSVAHPWSAVLPAIAMLGPQLVQRPIEASRALQSVGLLALLSFGYLAVEAATGFTAINFFGLMAAAYAAAHLGFATARPLHAWLIALGLGVIWWAVMALNGEDAAWHGAIIAPGLAVIVVSAMWPSRQPKAFASRPVLLLGVLAAIPVSLLLALEIMRASP